MYVISSYVSWNGKGWKSSRYPVIAFEPAKGSGIISSQVDAVQNNNQVLYVLSSVS